MTHLPRLRSLVILLFIAACTPPNSDKPVVPAKLELGPQHPLAEQTITSSGGTVTVSGSDVLNGLTVTVRPGSYTDTRTFTIGYEPIVSHTFGDNFHPVGPVITITNGGKYSEHLMTMKIPATIGPDDFVMVYAYDKATGKMEAIPLISEDANSVTITTRHFDYFRVGTSAGMFGGKGRVIMDDDNTTRLIAIKHRKSELLAASTPTDFRPGVDDFTFNNLGSIIAPGGHCMGQALAMSYYFIERKSLGAPQLHGLLDNDDFFSTPNVSLDDKSLYKWCSVLQGSYPKFVQTYNEEREIIDLVGGSPDDDTLTYLQFKAALELTKEPQFISIWRKDSKGELSGHAIITYGANGAGRLAICDPNYSGKNDREILLQATGFKPYNSGPDAAHLGVNYPTIIFSGISSILDWGVAAREYKNVERRSIGIGKFPAFTIKARDTETAEFQPLADGWQTTTGKAQFEIDYASSKPLMLRYLYRTNGTADDKREWYQIPDGSQNYGFYITSTDSQWSGFKWFEMKGRIANLGSPCTATRMWQTDLTYPGYGSQMWTDSSAQGIRSFYYEDPSEPSDICGDQHIHPEFELWGVDMSAFTITAKAYWSVFGDQKPMTVIDNLGGLTHYKTSMEIGMRQAFSDKPGWVGLQVLVQFPSVGSTAEDLAYMLEHISGARLSLKYITDPR